MSLLLDKRQMPMKKPTIVASGMQMTATSSVLRIPTIRASKLLDCRV